MLCRSLGVCALGSLNLLRHQQRVREWTLCCKTGCAPVDEAARSTGDDAAWLHADLEGVRPCCELEQKGGGHSGCAPVIRGAMTRW